MKNKRVVQLAEKKLREREREREGEKTSTLFGISVWEVHGPLIALDLKYFFQLNQTSLNRKIFNLIHDNSKNQLNPSDRG